MGKRRHRVVRDAEEDAPRNGFFVVLDFVLDEQLVLVFERARRCRRHSVGVKDPPNLDTLRSRASALWSRRLDVNGYLRRPELALDRRLHGVGQVVRILNRRSAEHGDRPTSVLMLVGPEGDFTPAELSLARSHGCRPITLGPIVLRVETASIYCLSVLSYELLV